MLSTILWLLFFAIIIFFVVRWWIDNGGWVIPGSEKSREIDRRVAERLKNMPKQSRKELMDWYESTKKY